MNGDERCSACIEEKGTKCVEVHCTLSLHFIRKWHGSTSVLQSCVQRNPDGWDVRMYGCYEGTSMVRVSSVKESSQSQVKSSQVKSSQGGSCDGCWVFWVSSDGRSAG